MKKLATKLTPAIKAWIKEEFGSDYYSNERNDFLFHFPNSKNHNGFIAGNHYFIELEYGYTEVSEQEFLAEFAKPKFDNTERVIEVRDYEHNEWEKRVLCKFIENKPVCWINAETIEEAKSEYMTKFWNFWREIPIKETITKEEAEELLAENGIHKTII